MALIKQSLSSAHIPSFLEPRPLYKTDQKRPDGLTLVPWAAGKQLMWDRFNPGTAAGEAEEQKKSFSTDSF